MKLIDNIYLIFPHLRRNAYLINQTSYIIHRVIGRRIQFKNIKGKIFIYFFSAILIDLFCKNPSTSSFSNTSWTSKQKGLSQMVIFNSIFERIGNSLLPYNVFKKGGSIFS